MGKRKLSTTSDALHTESRSHPAHGDVAGGYDIKTRVDPTTGQQSAFPGLEPAAGSEDDGGLFYGPAQDGMEYLRMVRAEAAKVPKLLQIHHQPSELLRNPDIDMAAFWSGDAMIAPPRGESEDEMLDEVGDGGGRHNPGPQDPQDVYYDALIARFLLLRQKLHSKNLNNNFFPEPINDAGILVDPSPIASMNAPQSSWYRAFSYVRPTPRFVASMPHTSVIIALERLEVLLTKRNMENPSRRQNLGVWSWALLARCREAGQLNGDEVSVLRTLAKTALHVEGKLRAASVMPQDPNPRAASMSEISDGLRDGNEDDAAAAAAAAVNFDDSTSAVEHGQPTSDDEMALIEARERLLHMMVPNSLEAVDEEVDPQEYSELEPALMTLDSIVTVVGRLFGQRDLLMQRSAW